MRCPRPAAAAVLAILAVASASPPVGAEAFLAKDEALAIAFPDASVEPKTVFLSEAEIAAVRVRTGDEPASKLFTAYEARRDGAVVGWAVIATHVVRTLPEAFLVVLTPDGTVARVLMLAFYEPPEYRPPDRWLEQFGGRREDDPSGWRVGGTIHGLSGATLTAHAVTKSIHEILATFAVVHATEAD